MDSGSFGTVAKCIDMKNDGQTVAIKIARVDDAKFAKNDAKMLETI